MSGTDDDDDFDEDDEDYEPDCETCNDESSIECPACKGAGVLESVLAGSMDCEKCDGTGEIECPDCCGD